MPGPPATTAFKEDLSPPVCSCPKMFEDSEYFEDLREINALTARIRIALIQSQ